MTNNNYGEMVRNKNRTHLIIHLQSKVEKQIVIV